MAKITLDVDDKNLSTVLTILKNLKSGLINNINESAIDSPKPISSSINNQSNKRYVSKQEYKQRLNQKVLEDEFLPKTTKASKYLSPDEYKKRLKG